MRFRKTLSLLTVLAAVAAAVTAAATSAAPAAGPTKVTAALVSDIGRFNDKSFNQSQLEGLMLAKKQLGATTMALQSNAVSDYLPNMTNAIRRRADIVISAGFLLADATAKVAAKFPGTKFAITDYSVNVPPFKGEQSSNVMGLTYQANEGGCLVGVLAAKMAQKMGKKIIGAVGGLKIPPVDIWIAGYRYCAQKAVPGTKVLIDYSQDFVAADKCKTLAQNQLSKGAQVLFQVAGQCGLGTLSAADDAGKWGIGVDKDQYNDAKRVLTSGVKRVDVGVYTAIRSVQDGTFEGGRDLAFDLKNKGMAVGRINPAVPRSFIATMSQYKARIIAGKLKVPTALK